MVVCALEIGHPGHKDRVHGYVLSDPPKSEGPIHDAVLDTLAERADWLVANEGERLMTEVAHQVQMVTKKGA